MSRPAVCQYVYQWIDDLRSDLYIAVRVDRLLELMNGYLEEVGASNRDVDVDRVSKSDLERCIKFDNTLKIVKAKDDVEVLLLWSDWRLYDLIDRVVEVATKEGEVAVSVP